MSTPEEASLHSIAQSSSTQPEPVVVNSYGVPISDNAGRIGSRVGKLIRIHVPISYERWDKVPKKFKDDVWNELLKFFQIESSAKDYFMKKMGESFRKHKSELRTNHYDKFDNDEDRSKNCPKTINQEDWDMFLKNEAKQGASKRRELGKRNRSVYNYGHHTGRTSHAVLEHKMTNANPTKVITRRHVWEKAHTKKDGTIPDNASLYFDKIAKVKETINDNDEEELPLDEDILSQAFGKDKKGRTRSIGTTISRTQIKASAIVRNQLKKAKGDTEELKSKMECMEGKLENMDDTLKTLVSLVKELGQGNHISDVTFNERGSSTRHESVGRNQINDVVAPLNSVGATNQQKCKILNLDHDVIAIATVCKDSTSFIIHGKSVPSTHEKLVVDNILLPDEKTSKQNHPLATTFAEVGIGGYVCHPKSAIRYL